MKFEENFAVIEMDALFPEALDDFVERMITERNKLLQRPFFDFENFVIIGDSMKELSFATLSPQRKKFFQSTMIVLISA